MTNIDRLYLEIGKRIAKARQDKKFTQAKLAGLLSLTRTSITNIEKGRQKLLVHTLLGLAECLTIPIVDLIPKVLKTKNAKARPKGVSSKEFAWVENVTEGGGNYGTSKKNNS